MSIDPRWAHVSEEINDAWEHLVDKWRVKPLSEESDFMKMLKAQEEREGPPT